MTDSVGKIRLNSKQKAVVEAGRKHVVVSAGAGTGKTSVITARAIHLLTVVGVKKPLLILTFTKRAAMDIRERLKKVEAINMDMVVVSTFHSWCWSVIKTAPFIKVAHGFIINDQADSESIMEQAIEETGVKLHRQKKVAVDIIRKVLAYRCNIQSDLNSAVDINCPEHSSKVEDIKLVRKTYRKLLIKDKRIDFEDIINIVSIKVNKSLEAKEWLIDQYSSILIDEAQDTNKLQWALIKPLSEKLPLFVVGDDAQAIYGFRGTTLDSLTSMSKMLKGVLRRTLSVNYRSTQPILNMSNGLSQHKGMASRYLRCTAKKSKRKERLPEVLTFMDERSQMLYIIKQIKKRQAKDLSLNDVLILVRSNAEIEYASSMFTDNNIDHKVLGKEFGNKTQHIKDVIAVLRLSIGHNDALIWTRYLLLCEGIGKKSIDKVLPTLLKAKSVTNAKAMIKKLKLPLKTQSNILNTLTFLIELKRFSHQPNKAIITVLKRFGKVLRKSYGKRKEGWPRYRDDLKLFAKQAAKYEQLAEYLDNFDLDRETEDAEYSNSVSIMTVHAAKGAEAKICFVLHVSPGNYPHRKNKKDDEVNEDLRVFYVALTRAKKRLVLTTLLSNHSKPTHASKTVNERYFLTDLPSELYVAN